MNEVLSDNDCKQMLTWAADYQEVLAEWEKEFQANEGNPLEELKGDLRQIRRLQRWCAEHLSSDNGAAIMCSKLSGVAGNLLDQSLTRLDMIQWRESGLAGAREAKLVEDRINHLIYLSYAHFMNNNPSFALDLINEAIELSSQQKNSKEYATALHLCGTFYVQMKREDEAIKILNEALSIFEYLSDDRIAIASVLSALASCQSHLDEPQKAIDLYHQAIEIEIKVGTKRSLGSHFCNMSGDLMKLQRFPEAKSYLAQAERIADEFSYLRLKGLARANLGHWYLLQKDQNSFNTSLKYYRDALTIFHQTGDRYHAKQVMDMLESIYTQMLNQPDQQLSYEQETEALRSVMSWLYNQNRHSENINSCNRLLELATKNNNLPDQLEAARVLGHTFVHLKRYTEAIKTHTQAIDILNKIRKREEQDKKIESEELEIQLSLGQAYRHSSQPSKAIECYEIAEKIADSLQNKPDEKYLAVGNRGLTYADIGQYNDALKLLQSVAEHYDYEHSNNHRLLGHAQFNLAYTYYRKGDLTEAKLRGAEALRYLTMIDDSYVEEVKRQINSWGE